MAEDTAAPEPQAAAPASAPATPSPATPVTPQAASPQASAPQAASPSPPPSWRDKAKNFGLDFGEADDDRALSQLAQAYRDAQQIRPLLPHVQNFIKNKDQFQEFLKAQQAQQKPAEKPYYADYWSPPEFDDSWMTHLRTDPQTNEVVAAPGAPMGIVEKFKEYKAWEAQQAQKLIRNPHTFIEPTIKTLAKQIAEEVYNQKFGEHQQKQEDQRFREENAPWLFERDQQGQQKYSAFLNPLTGQHEQRPVLSPWGLRFGEVMNGEVQKGLSREHAKLNALRQINLEYQLAENQQLKQQLLQWQGQTPPIPGASSPPAPPAVSEREAANEAFLEQNGNQTKRGNAVKAPKKVSAFNLEEMILENGRKAGVKF